MLVSSKIVISFFAKFKSEFGRMNPTSMINCGRPVNTLVEKIYSLLIYSNLNFLEADHFQLKGRVLARYSRQIRKMRLIIEQLCKILRIYAFDLAIFSKNNLFFL